MINLPTTSTKIYISTSAAGTVHCHASWVELSGTTITPGSVNTAAITTATNTDIVTAPAASTVRNVKFLSVFNAHASVSNNVTIYLTDGTNANKLVSSTLTTGQALVFVEGSGWRKTTISGATDVTSADGNTVLYGAGAPIAAQGVDGNFYIDTTAHDLYGPKASGAWPSGIHLIGAPIPRVTTIADTGTAPVDASTTDAYVITALAQALTFAAPSGGTPSSEQCLMYVIKDNGTARALAWNAIFIARGVALPSTTVAGKWLRMGFLYNATASKWDLVGNSQES